MILENIDLLSLSVLGQKNIGLLEPYEIDCWCIENHDFSVAPEEKNGKNN